MRLSLPVHNDREGVREMSFKLLGWIGKVLATVLLASFLTLWTTGYIITSYVESLLKQYEIPIEVPPIAMSGLWGKLWGSDIDQLVELPQSDVEGNDANQDIEGSEQTPLTQNDNSDSQDENEDKEVHGVFAPVELDDEEVTMTNEEIDNKKSNMNDEDSQRLLDLLMSKLPADSWQTFSTYIEDGLTDQELLSVQQMMAQHLSGDEYEELMSILERYDESM